MAFLFVRSKRFNLESLDPRNSSDDADFTEFHYGEILDVAKRNYAFATYPDMPIGKKFVLWRHDVDVSLNRAEKLAELEADRNLTATYFLDLHSMFYNVFEESQAKIVKRILGMGHRIGLHFDANFYNPKQEPELELMIERESRILCDVFSHELDAVSFHNPSEVHLGWNRWSYAGLVNCYSAELMKLTRYCSDSKGYWRFERLFDVVSQGTDKQLQVLTHPELWQEVSMAPRQRIYRSTYGRARRTVQTYDEMTRATGHINHTGLPQSLLSIAARSPDEYEFFDFLWNENRLQTLLSELQITFSRIVLQTVTEYSSTNIEPLRGTVSATSDEDAHPEVHAKFENRFGLSVWEAIDSSLKEYQLHLSTVRLMRWGRNVAHGAVLNAIDYFGYGIAKISRYVNNNGGTHNIAFQ